jgi:catechol 2,3-dioxygenase-like lactoylglutathione lyase family enzyme
MEDLTTTGAHAQPRITIVLAGAEPQLVVADLAASIEFFTIQLGFSVAFSHGDPPFYAQVVRDAARLNLRHLDTPALDTGLRDREQILSATITLDDAEPLFLEYEAAGADY